MSSEERAVINVFCSYSDEDRRFQENLERHLNSLVRKGSVLVWDKHKVQPGQERRHEIDAQLEQARLILLLISSNFISSDDCYARDLAIALQRNRHANIRVIAILLKPCTWDELAFSSFQILPRNRLAVSRWKNRDLAFSQIVEEIEKVVQELRQYGDTCIEPLQPNPLRRVPSESSLPTANNQRTRTVQKTNGTQRKRETRSRKQTNTFREEAIISTNMKYVRTLPRSRSTSVGSTIGRFLTFFLSNLSGKAFHRRCERWKGNSALLLVFFALLDIFGLPYTVYLRSHAQILTVAIGVISLFLFGLGVCNKDNAIGVSIALVYFLIWIGMVLWYFNSYLGSGSSQLSIFILILVFITTIGRLFLFLWRSPFGQR